MHRFVKKSVIAFLWAATGQVAANYIQEVRVNYMMDNIVYKGLTIVQN